MPRTVVRAVLWIAALAAAAWVMREPQRSPGRCCPLPVSVLSARGASKAPPSVCGVASPPTSSPKRVSTNRGDVVK